MKDIKGHRLYLSLSASQVRKRLKGVGYGVRKVETTGKNQSVIIHTASGQHLRALEAMFADVLVPPAPQELEDGESHPPSADDVLD